MLGLGPGRREGEERCLESEPERKEGEKTRQGRGNVVGKKGRKVKEKKWVEKRHRTSEIFLWVMRKGASFSDIHNSNSA